MPSVEYLEARKKIREAKAFAQNEAKRIFENEAKAIVEELGIKSFSWTQYTPYFNDGDACVFSVYNDYPAINGHDEYEGPDAPKYLYGEALAALSPEERAEYDRAQEEYRAPYKRVAEFLRSWEEEDFLFMFGDHVEVTVTKDSIEVDDYSHD